MTPDYVQTLLPPTHAQARYPRRRGTTLVPPRANSERYNQSVIPTAVRRWNEQDQDMRESVSVSSFKQCVREKICRNMRTIYSHFRGKHSIAHTRMRLGLSPLQQHLYSLHVRPTPTCQLCLEEDETPEHYLLRCPNHTASRVNLFHKLRSAVVRLGIDINNHNTLTQILLKGHFNNNLTDNIQLLTYVQEFIAETKRF